MASQPTGSDRTPTALADAIRLLARGGTPDEATITAAMGAVVDGTAPEAAVGALLMGLRCRGETLDALIGTARAIRERMLSIKTPPGTIDVAGTGGDGRHTLNVSTAVAFVVRACGIPVAKLGNGAFSSRSGGADVVAALGLAHDPPVEQQLSRLDTQGIAFLYGPRHLSALRHAAPARRALGIPTLLNLAAPICNPAGVRHQLLGVFDPDWLERIARAIAAFGMERAWVVHGDGLDELTIASESQVVVVDHGSIERRVVAPEDAGLKRAPRDAITGGTPQDNARALEALLDGAPGPYRDIVLLNAAAALMISGQVGDLREGVDAASGVIDAGKAAAVLQQLRDAETIRQRRSAPR